MRLPALLCVALLFAVPVGVRATDTVANNSDSSRGKVIEKPVLADTPEKFAEQTQHIYDDMKPGGRYEYITPSEKRRVEMLLGQMAALLEHAGSVDAMNHDTRLQLFNDQEFVNGILKHNDINRLVCESRAPIGSHIPVTTCHTYGQIQATARGTQQGLMEFDHSRLCNGVNVEMGCQPDLNHPNRTGH